MKRCLYFLSLIVPISVVQSFVLPSSSRRCFGGSCDCRQLQRTAQSSPALLLSKTPDDDFDRVKVPIRRRRDRYPDDEFEEDEDDEYYSVDSEFEDDEEWDDEEDDEDWDDDEEQYGLFSNVIIANPLLDSMDPDGAAERFPELAADPRFWFDMFLFICVLNFLSTCAARDPLPPISWY